MGILSSSATAASTSNVTVNLEAFPPAADATATASVCFGSSDSALGSPQALTVGPAQDTSLPPGSIHGSGTFDPSALGVATVSYRLYVEWSDGSKDDSGPLSVNLPVAPPSTQPGPPASSAPVPDGKGNMSITWSTPGQPGVGLVRYHLDGQPDDHECEEASTENHKVTLEELIPQAVYKFRCETDLDDSDVTLVSDEFTFTAPDSSDVPPGRVSICANPIRVKLHNPSTVTMTVRKRNGQGEAGIGVAFSLGAGKLEGTLSGSAVVTDAQGRASVTFIPSGLPVGRKKARRFVVAIATAQGKSKRRRAVVIGLA